MHTGPHIQYNFTQDVGNNFYSAVLQNTFLCTAAHGRFVAGNNENDACGNIKNESYISTINPL